MNSSFLIVILVTVLYGSYRCELVSQGDECQHEKCIANLVFDNGTIKGIMIIEDKDGIIRLRGRFSGLEHGEHPIHIHVTNDLSNNCRSTKEIYNPLKETLNCPGSPYMIGHLHTLVASRNGKASFELDKLGQITHPFNISGRAVVIHDKLNIEGPVMRNETTGKIIGYPGNMLACAQINMKCTTYC